jgi:predicted MFS family arabinose efflux permease
VHDSEHDPGHPDGFPEEDPQGPPKRTLLTRPVLLTISVYAIHAYLEVSNFALVPLVYTTPIELGGLGLDPEHMATCLAAFGILTGILPFFFFHRIVKSLGLRRALITFMTGLLPAFLFFPINGTRARHAGAVDAVTWILLFAHLFMMVGIHMTYGMP